MLMTLSRFLGTQLLPRVLCCMIATASCVAQEPSKESEALSQQRMDLMRRRALAFRLSTDKNSRPVQLESEPLFRYDDIPRGYVDGAVWRWGKTGRPLAIITTELHPTYLGSSQRVVYDFLSLSEVPFSAVSDDVSWRPTESAVKMQPLETGAPPAQTSAQRRFQMKRILQGFSAAQVVTEEMPEESRLKLRLLPTPIETYQPDGEGTDGAVFLFVAGRMPGVIVFLETRGKKWEFGIGRLSAPSTLTVSVGDKEVYRVPPSTGGYSSPYLATNSPAKIPGY